MSEARIDISVVINALEDATANLRTLRHLVGSGVNPFAMDSVRQIALRVKGAAMALDNAAWPITGAVNVFEQIASAPVAEGKV